MRRYYSLVLFIRFLHRNDGDALRLLTAGILTLIEVLRVLIVLLNWVSIWICVHMIGELILIRCRFASRGRGLMTLFKIL